MLTIVVLGKEHYDEENNRFITEGDITLELEHSLVTLATWEEKHEKAFLGPEDKTSEEILSYIDIMIQSKNYPSNIVEKLSADNINQINAYINQKSTATWFKEEQRPTKAREIITAELVYFWMISFNVPLECEHWHLNRLFTLLKVCSVKQQTPKKRSSRDIAQSNAQINEQRRKQYGTRG